MRPLRGHLVPIWLQCLRSLPRPDPPRPAPSRACRFPSMAEAMRILQDLQMTSLLPVARSGARGPWFPSSHARTLG